MIGQEPPRQRTVRKPPERVKTPPGTWPRVLHYSVLTAAAAFLLAVSPLKWWQVTVLDIAVSIAAVSVASRRAKPLALWMLGWLVVINGWLTWAMLTTPWRPAPVLALVAAVVALSAPGVHALAHDAHVQARLDARDAERDAARYLRRWTAVFEAIGCPGVEAIEETEHGSGRVVLLRQPPGVSLPARQEDVERKLRARRGSVRFEEVKGDASLIRMHVVEREFLGKPQPLPELPPTMTITEPLPLGLREDGQRGAVLFRETATFVGGVRGSGKSNLATVLIALSGRCVDTINCGIDVDKGGRLFTPWILPWVEGKAIRPAIDWIATTREEAEIMLRALLAIRQARSDAAIGGSKITPSPSMPQINLYGDEIAGLFGQDFTRREGLSNAAFFKLGMDLTRLSRSEAIEPVWLAQRGTGSFTGGNDLKSQCDTRVGMGTMTMAEAQSIVGDDGQAAKLMSMLTEQGSAVIERRGQRRPMPLMLYRLDQSVPADAARIERIAIENALIRPDLDELSRRAAGEAWALRWDNSSLYQRLLAEHVPAEQRAPRRGKAGTATLPGDVVSAWSGIIGHLDDLRVPGTRPAWRERVIAMLSDPDRARIGWSVQEIEHRLKTEGIGVVRETISRYLNNELIPGGIAERHNGLYRARRDRIT